jgi:hypothetical protein
VAGRVRPNAICEGGLTRKEPAGRNLDCLDEMLRRTLQICFLLSTVPSKALRVRSSLSPAVCCLYPAAKVLDDKAMSSYGKATPIEIERPDEGDQPVLRPVPDPGPAYFSACENCDMPTKFDFDGKSSAPLPEDPNLGQEQPFYVITRSSQVSESDRQSPPLPEIPVFDPGVLHNR